MAFNSISNPGDTTKLIFCSSYYTLNILFYIINNFYGDNRSGKVRKMSTRTLSISEEVYARLNAERREGENFNDVLIRLTEKKSLMNIAGFLKERDAEEMWKVIKEMREKSRDRTLRIVEETKQR